MSILRLFAALCVLPALFSGVEAGGFIDKEFEEARSALIEGQNSSASIVHAYRCFSFRSRLGSPARVDQTFHTLLKSKSLHPLLRDHIEWFLAGIDQGRGDIRSAQARCNRLGLIRDWCIVGPFDNEGKLGFEKEYPPEKSQNFKATYQGKERNISWREFPDVNLLGYQNFEAVLRPNLLVCAFAFAAVECKKYQVAAVRVGSDDAVKVWVNGALVIANAAYRPAGFDQDAAGIILRKGVNRILVKVCQKEGGWGFRLRLTGTSGGPLSGIRIISADKLMKMPPRGPKVAFTEKVKIDNPLAELKLRAEQQTDSAEVHRQFGYLIEATRAGDEDQKLYRKEYRRAVELDPADVQTLLSLSRSSTDHNRRRDLLERVLKINPRYAPALYDLAAYYRGRGDTTREFDLLRQANESDPDYVSAAAVLAYNYAFSSLRGLAWDRIVKLKARFPESGLVDYETGVIAEALGLRDEAAKAYGRYLEQHRTHSQVRSYLIKRAARKGDLRQCLKLYEQSIEIYPDNLNIRQTKARFLANNGKLKRAIQELEKCFEICPEDSKTIESLGALYRRSGDLQKAVSLWKKSLRLFPQNPELREYLDFFVKEEDAFEAPYLVDAKLLAAQPVSKDLSNGSPAVFLADIVVQKLHENGTVSTFTQNVIRILTRRGAEQQRNHRVYFTADKEVASIEAYRIIRPGGREVLAGNIVERRVVQGEQNVYYDYRVKLLRLPRLEVGDVVEIKHRVSDIAERNYFGEHFGNVEMFRKKLPMLQKKYVLISPSSRTLYHSQQHLNPPKITEGAFKTYTWSSENVKSLPSEPYIPPLTTFAPYVHVSSFKDWNQVADYYSNMIRDQFRINASVREAVTQVVKGKKSDKEIIQALYHYLSKKTRYVALEFGIHGYLPYPAEQVFERKYGDCKDKAVLLASMLRVAGIDAQIALVRTRLRGELQARPASLAAFDHAICYVPKYKLWLDCTTEFNGSGELPDMDQGAMALLIGDGNSRGIVRPPQVQPSQNLQSYRIRATVNPNGSLKGKGSNRTQGSRCPSLRNMFEQEGRRRNIFESMFRHYHPSARIPSAKFSDLENLESDIEINFDFVIPDYARKRDGELQFQPSLLQQGLVRRYAPLSSRELPMELSAPWKRQQSTEIKLPKGAQCLYIPSKLEMKSEFGVYRYELKLKSDALELTDELSLNAMRIEVAEYQAFRSFCQKVDEKRIEHVRIQLPKF